MFLFFEGSQFTGAYCLKAGVSYILFSFIVLSRGTIWFQILHHSWKQTPIPEFFLKSIMVFSYMFSTACVLSWVWLFATLWTAARQTSLSMEFSRQEYWSGSSFPIPGNLPDSGIKHTCLCLLHWRVDALPLNHLGSPCFQLNLQKIQCKVEIPLSQTQQTNQHLYEIPKYLFLSASSIFFSQMASFTLNYLKSH